MENKNKFRLNRAISLTGVASRRKADELIKSGKVKVNGKIVKDFNCKVLLNEKIEILGKEAKIKDYKYIALYKPKGYITTTKDEHNRKTIYDLLPEEFKCLKPVGRLDRETEGLIILSNDGEFINKVLHPRNSIKKSYWVTIAQALSRDDILNIHRKLSEGIKLDGKLCKADELLLVGLEKSKLKQTIFKIVIHEGVNRQIRRMFQILGYSVLSLKRVNIGKLGLEGLKKGEYKQLGLKDINGLFESQK